MKFCRLALLLLPLHAHAAIDPVVDAADRRLPDSPALERAAAAHFPKRRALAARAYGEIMSPKGIDPLLKLTNDPMPWVREEAAFALGQLGWVAGAAGGREDAITTRLTELLKDKRIEVRLAAAEALGKIAGEKAPELLAPLFRAKEPSLRATAVMALFRARMILKLRDPEHPPGALPDGILSQLTELSRDADAGVRRSVAYLFARTAEPKGIPAVGNLLSDADAEVRLFAVTALAKNKVKAPPAAFRDESYAVRVAAVAADQAAGEAVPTELLQDKTFHVRAAAVAALKPDDRALPEALAHDESPTVKAEALKAIAKGKGAELETFLREELRSPLWQLQEAAVQASDPLEPKAKEKFLFDALAADNKLVRAAALEPLFAIPSDNAFEQLKKSLASPELSERATAVGALAGRKEDVFALAKKAYADSLDPKWVETREDLLEVFIKTNTPDTTDFLKQTLNDPDRGVRAKARDALQKRGVTDLPELRDPELTFSPFRDDTFRRNPLVEIRTSKGFFTVECFAKDAPIHVADFLGHVKAGFYDDLPWHRVISNFVVQGGDPDGTGFGGAGYALRAEINRQPFKRGALGMPRSQGFDTGGGQLFFSLVPTPHLDGQYTVFGQVVKGVEVLDKLERGDHIIGAKRIR